eukprot:s2594_g4.t1
MYRALNSKANLMRHLLICLLLHALPSAGQLPGFDRRCDDRPTTEQVEKWCETNCIRLLAFLRMRSEFKSVDFNLYNAANAMNTWSSCPSAHRGLLLARAVDKIEGLPLTEGGRELARKVVLSTEYLARDFVLGVNLTGYLMSGTSYAPWFHIGKVYAAVKEKFPDILQVMGEPPPSARRSVLLATLKSYLEQDSRVEH